MCCPMLRRSNRTLKSHEPIRLMMYRSFVTRTMDMRAWVGTGRRWALLRQPFWPASAVTAAWSSPVKTPSALKLARSAYGGPPLPALRSIVHSRSAARGAMLEATVVQPLALPNYCSGCGVKLQAADSDVPGYASTLYTSYEPSLAFKPARGAGFSRCPSGSQSQKSRV